MMAFRMMRTCVHFFPGQLKGMGVRLLIPIMTELMMIMIPAKPYRVWQDIMGVRYRIRMETESTMNMIPAGRFRALPDTMDVRYLTETAMALMMKRINALISPGAKKITDVL